MSATVIIPTTGAPELRKAIESVLVQTYPTICYVVCDGVDTYGKVKVISDDYLGAPNLKIAHLPINVGANGYYGHRVYAAFTHLVNTDYVLYLDQDNWFDKEHVETCVETIQQNDLYWSYSLRKICDKYGEYICNDDCESLGKWQTYHHVNHIDTNSYCIKTPIAVTLASVWHGGWGQDRVFLQALSRHYVNYHCTGKYSVNYRVDGNPGSVNKEFFINGNKIMNEKYKGEFPWRKV
jgi:glycosyltransferase involved in cell wall biosynthesis